MKKLIFVYNANSGIVDSWLDMAHKIVSPKTYVCDLCTLTHGSFREKRIWKKFKDSYPISMEFYHKDEFLKAFASKWLPDYDFPIVLVAENEGLHPIISMTDFREIKNIENLIKRLEVLSFQDYC